eukprot:1134494-Pelagomonas_calceolata.AAC.13
MEWAGFARSRLCWACRCYGGAAATSKKQTTQCYCNNHRLPWCRFCIASALKGLPQGLFAGSNAEKHEYSTLKEFLPGAAAANF